MWDSRVFSMKFKISERNFLAVLGSWSGISSKFGLLNIYAPQASLLKDQLWSSNETIMNEYDVIWILFRDYNVVRHRGERVGSSFDAGEANTFNDFISRTGLFDFSLNGRRFTRFDSGGLKASKLDRDLLPLISTSWASNSSFLPPDLSLKNKIKKLRSDIKAWTMNKISAQNEVRDVLSRGLLDWDIKVEAGLINDEDIIKREEWMMDLDHLDQLQREDLKQKCRMRWEIKGDENSKFFHYLLKCNYANFNIKGVHVNGV
ncbi:cytochrome P450 [Tanacetum coccineum]